MKRSLFALIAAALLLYACTSEAATPPPEPTPTAKPTNTPEPTATTVPPTETPTPAPTPTAVPATPRPEPQETAATPTPLPPTPTPDVPFEEVSFITDDGVNIAATLFGDGEIAVILLHMGAGNATKKSWQPFARLVAERGFTALTVDFRGRGRSEGSLTQEDLIRDARAAVEFLREWGLERFVCVGASMGGTTCIRLSSEADLEGLVVISSAMTSGSYRVSAQDLSQPALPKLFVYGSKDGIIPSHMAQMYHMSSEPKELVAYESGAHGTDLFHSAQADEFRQQLLNFFEEMLNAE